MQIVGIDHVVLRVNDLEAMIRFYEGVLGCEVVHRQDRIGLVHLRAGSSLIDLVDVAGPLGRARGGSPDGPPNMDHLCLRVAGFDAERVRLELASQGATSRSRPSASAPPARRFPSIFAIRRETASSFAPSGEDRLLHPDRT